MTSFESIPKDEELDRDRLTGLLKAKMERENPEQMHRDAHPKMHGLAQAYFEVEPKLDPSLQQGIFSQAKRYQAWVRFSNQNAPPLPDNRRDIRGVGIKIMGVEGESIPLADESHNTQDFVLISTPAFVTQNVKEFCQLIKALTHSKLSLILFFIFHWRSAYNLWKANKKCGSPLKIRYWSTTPYLLGSEQAVKYSLIPQQSSDDEIPKNPDDNFLRQRLEQQLSEQEFRFDFCIQKQTQPSKMPIENPALIWSETLSPFVKVATLVIPKQDCASEARYRWGRQLSFNPWHSLQAHQPLGGINRARKIIYQTLSSFRHQRNHQAQVHPQNFDIPELSPEAELSPTKQNTNNPAHANPQEA